MSTATVTSLIQFIAENDGAWQIMWHILAKTEEALSKLDSSLHLTKLGGTLPGAPEAWAALRQKQLAKALSAAQSATSEKDVMMTAETLHNLCKAFLFQDQAPADLSGDCIADSTICLANGLQMIGAISGIFPFEEGATFKGEYVLRKTVDGIHKSKMFCHPSWIKLMGFRVPPLILLEDHNVPAMELYLLLLNYATYIDTCMAFGKNVPTISFNIGDEVMALALACDKCLIGQGLGVPAFEYEFHTDPTEEILVLLEELRKNRARDEVLCDDVPIFKLNSNAEWMAWVEKRFLQGTAIVKISFKDCTKLANMTAEAMSEKLMQMLTHLPKGLTVVLEWGGLLMFSSDAPKAPSADHVRFRDNDKMDKQKTVCLFDTVRTIFGEGQVLAQSGYVSQCTNRQISESMADDAITTYMHHQWAVAMDLEITDWEGMALKTAWGVGDHALGALDVVKIWQTSKCRGDFVPDPDYIRMRIEK